jgi:hypothetical protein
VSAIAQGLPSLGANDTASTNSVPGQIDRLIAILAEWPLIDLLVGKMYEVRKYGCLTNHMWDGFRVLLSKRVRDRSR